MSTETIGPRYGRQTGRTRASRQHLSLVWLALSLGCPGITAAPAAPMNVLDPRYARFPYSSLANLTELLDAPAGKHGFVRVGADGHFYFEKGGRARFFGINVAGRSLFVDDATIDQVVDVFARAGLNMVRLHHFDDVYGVIDGDQSDSRHLHPDRLRALDYWIARLKERGIYTYLDLLDYRTFKTGDGVPNGEKLDRGAKPYACFDPRLIELQKEYATKLLKEHVNPFTHLSYADDPAVALVELCDENGLLIRRSQWRTLVSPYQEQLAARWNDFLRQRHGNTGTLRARWTNFRGEQALRPDESLERGTVELPAMELGELNDSPYAASVRSPVRKNEGALFAYEVQRQYFRAMKQHLRGLGVSVPLTAVVSNHQMPDLQSVADELDFVGNNYYQDHPSWPAGKDWKLPSYFHGDNPVANEDEFGFAPWVTLSRMAGKPLVVREWGYCWPNRYRSAGIVEATAYGLLQDLDALLLFTYGTEDSVNPVSYFDVHADPARWSLVGACATAFLRQDVSAARRSAEVCYSQVDTFYYFRYHSPLYRLAWVTRTQNRLYDDEWTTSSGLSIASGRSGTGRLLGAGRLLSAAGRSLDLADSARAPVPLSVATLALPTKESATRAVSFAGLLFGDGVRKTLQLWPPFDLAALRQRGCEPIGVSEQTGEAYGLYDPQTRSFAFNSLSAGNTLRLSLDALRKLYDAPVSHVSVDTRTFCSDTGELERHCAEGLLTVDAPRFQAVAGALKPAERQLSGLRVAGLSGPGVALALSLTSQPLQTTPDFLIRVATDARNEAQAVTQPGAGGTARGVVRSFGRAPVCTDGRPTDRPCRFRVGELGEINVYQSGGCYELVRLGGRWYWWSDTPGAGLQLPGFAGRVRARVHKLEGTSEVAVVTDGILRYPVTTTALSVPAESG